MSLKALIRFIVKDLLSSKRFTLFFALNLSLGLFGFLALDAFKEGIEKTMAQKSKAILGADIGIGARRALTPQELQLADEIFKSSLDSTRTIETYSMVASASNSRLVELKAVESNYPFYGELELEKQGTVTGSSDKDLFTSDSVWVYPELLLQLNLKIGDKIKIGDLHATIADVINKDSSGMGSGFSFAPPVYISQRSFEKTNLLKFGSTSFQAKLYKMPADIDQDALSTEASKKFKDPGLQILAHKNSSEQISRLLVRLNDYLGLASLVALFLTALGTTFLYRSHLARRYKDVAILKSLGQATSSIETTYLMQLVLLGLISTVPVFIFCYFCFPFLGSWVTEQLGSEISLQVSSRTAFLAFVSGILTCTLVCYPMISSLQKIHPRQLFQGVEFQGQNLNWKQALLYTPAIFVFWGLSVWLAKSWYVSSLFILLFTISFLVLAGSAWVGFEILNKLRPRSLYLRVPVRNLSRQKFSSVSIFLAISLGSLFMNLIPQVQTSLAKEIESPSGTKVPGLFLIDIQEDQVQDVQQTILNLGTELMYSSPMIRARLEYVNDLPFEKADASQQVFSREEETENRFRNRGFNLSYRHELSDSETIVEGDSFSGRFDPQTQALPWISLEKRFAERLKLKIGDRLKFDIQGISVEGQVKNFRQIKWTSFQPNFFVQFQEGAIEDAPKTFLAGVPNTPKDQKIKIQNVLVQKFPNVSIIDISQVIKRISEVMDQMSLAISGMAILSILVGMAILFSIANQKALERRKEINLLKILGADFKLISGLFFIEFLLITASAAVMGILLSLVANIFMTKFIFESEVSFDFSTPIWLLLATMALTTLVCWLATRSVLNEKPRRVLAES